MKNLAGILVVFAFFLSSSSEAQTVVIPDEGLIHWQQVDPQNLFDVVVRQRLNGGQRIWSEFREGRFLRWEEVNQMLHYLRFLSPEILKKRASVLDQIEDAWVQEVTRLDPKGKFRERLKAQAVPYIGLMFIEAAREFNQVYSIRLFLGSILAVVHPPPISLSSDNKIDWATIDPEKKVSEAVRIFIDDGQSAWEVYKNNGHIISERAIASYLGLWDAKLVKKNRKELAAVEKAAKKIVSQIEEGLRQREEGGGGHSDQVSHPEYMFLVEGLRQISSKPSAGSCGFLGNPLGWIFGR